VVFSGGNDCNLLCTKKINVFENLGGQLPVVGLIIWHNSIRLAVYVVASSLWHGSYYAFYAFSEVVLLKYLSNAPFSFSALAFVCPSFSLLLTAT